MNAEFWALLTLVLYCIGGAGALLWHISRCRCGWRVWMLYAPQRVYLGLVFRWRCNRPCPFPEHGPALIIANHSSPVDPLMIWNNHSHGWAGSRIRVIAFMTAREYYNVPVVNWVCRAVQCIPVDRQGEDMRPARAALKWLQSGELLGVFPEGRINNGKTLLPGNPGTAWLALKAKVPVFPVFIHNSPRGESMVKPFITPSRVRVVYGDPIDLSPYFDQKMSRELLGEVTGVLMEHLAKTGGVYDRTQPDDDKRVSIPISRATG